MSYKYVGGPWRVCISYDTGTMWYRNYAQVSFHFLPEEIEGKKADFALAAGCSIKAAINNVSKDKIEKYNRNTCIKDKYVNIHFTEGTDWKEVEALILRACDFLIETPFNRESTNQFIKLACKYEKEVKEFAKAVKNDIINKVLGDSYEKSETNIKRDFY